MQQTDRHKVADYVKSEQHFIGWLAFSKRSLAVGSLSAVSQWSLWGNAPMKTFSLLSRTRAVDGGWLRVYAIHTPSMSALTDDAAFDRFPRFDCPATSTDNNFTYAYHHRLSEYRESYRPICSVHINISTFSQNSFRYLHIKRLSKTNQLSLYPSSTPA